MKRPNGFLHWIFPAIIAFAALNVLQSGRDLSALMTSLVSVAEPVRTPLIAWSQRVVSLLVLLVTAERIATHFAYRERLPSPALVCAFVAFWLATVAAPAFYGSNPVISHDYAYTLLLGVALAIARAKEGQKVIGAARNALLVFILAGIVLIPFNTRLVLDLTYSQGLMAGVPRFAGLSAHSVTMGTLALGALLCLWHRPFQSRWLNGAAWLVGLAALFFAQSKTGWIAFILGAIAIITIRHGPSFWRRLGDTRNNSFGILVCAGFMLAVVGVMTVLMLGIAEERISSFLSSSQGAQLVTLTGRDQIWSIAMEEWHQNWWFGYGPKLWDEVFRASIGMPNATHAHNQLLDTLARSGTVGGAALIVYSIVLLVLSVRYARATRGLSMALFLALALYSISEVPMLMFSYGPEVFTHLLLVVTLASAAAARQPVEVRLPGDLRVAS